MVSHLLFYQLGLIALVCLFLMLSGLWPSAPAAARPMTRKPLLPRGKHSKKPKPFPGLTRQPCCAACEQVREAPRLQSSPSPPPTMPSTRGRRRHVDTSQHFCPDPACRYGGWLGRGNITANRPPSGGPWRQLYWPKYSEATVRATLFQPVVLPIYFCSYFYEIRMVLRCYGRHCSVTTLPKMIADARCVSWINSLFCFRLPLLTLPKRSPFGKVTWMGKRRLLPQMTASLYLGQYAK